MAKSKCKKGLGRFHPVPRDKKPWDYLPNNRKSRTLVVRRRGNIEAELSADDIRQALIEKTTPQPTHLHG